MKRSLIITAMLVAALQISAQSSNRSRTTVESASKNENALTNSQQEKTEKKTATRQSPSTAPSTVTTRESRSPSTGSQSERISSQPTTRSRNTEVSTQTSTSQPAANPQRRVNTSQSENNNRSTQPSTRKATAQPANNPERRVSTTPRQSTTTGREAASPSRNTSTRTSSSVNTGSEATSRSDQSSRGTTYTPRTAPKYEEARKSYETPARKSVVRTTYHTGYTYRPVEYRRVHSPYRSPAQVNVYWSLPMYHQYRTIYPDYQYWHYPIGYRINTVSAYDAGFYIGEMARIYGRVEYIWYSRPTNEYYLYFGGPYPYQDFSVIIPASVARRFNRRPERFFTNRHIVVTGLVSRWEGKPEMLIKKVNQLDIY